MTALIWIKEKALWILGILVVILGALFAVKHEKEKARKARLQATVSGALVDIEKERTRKKVALAKEEILAEQDAEVGDRVDAREKEISTVKDKVKGMDDDEVADGFNSMYSSNR